MPNKKKGPANNICEVCGGRYKQFKTRTVHFKSQKHIRMLALRESIKESIKELMSKKSIVEV